MGLFTTQEEGVESWRRREKGKTRRYRERVRLGGGVGEQRPELGWGMSWQVPARLVGGEALRALVAIWALPQDPHWLSCS